MIDNKLYILSQTIEGTPRFFLLIEEVNWRMQTMNKGIKKAIGLIIFFPCCIAYFSLAATSNIYNKIKEIF
jgi:hypothetical protein